MAKIKLTCDDFSNIGAEHSIDCCNGCHEDAENHDDPLIQIESDKIRGVVCCSIMRLIDIEPNALELAYLKKVF